MLEYIPCTYYMYIQMYMYHKNPRTLYIVYMYTCTNM